MYVNSRSSFIEDVTSSDQWTTADYREIFESAPRQQIQFVMDTGASRSVVSNAAILHNVRRVNSTIQYGKGSTLIQWTGDVILENHRSSMVVIRDVLLDPDCPVNVLSMRRFCQRYGLRGMHDAEEYSLFDPNSNTAVLIGKARL